LALKEEIANDATGNYMLEPYQYIKI